VRRKQDQNEALEHITRSRLVKCIGQVLKQSMLEVDLESANPNLEASMAKESLLEKLRTAPASSFHVLEAEKAARMNAKTLFIPSVEDVAKAISAIPAGQTRTINELRNDLAVTGKAETACPAKTIKYWKWLAAAHEELEDERQYDIPWWRVLKDGKPSRHMPGGIEAQTALLRAEGVKI
jgi:6-O-methylguanine DNA methyltransferase, DNA binding domain